MAEASEKGLARRQVLQESQAPFPLAHGVEAALMHGDINKLDPKQRVEYYMALCMSLGLNPLTRPFGFIKDQEGKLQPYARKECAEQLRKIHQVSTRIVNREWLDDLYIITVEASMPNGRCEESQGIVSITSKGQAKANEMMKAETKGKRRATLALIGLGLDLGDEHHEVRFDVQTGEIVEETPHLLPEMGVGSLTATDTLFPPRPVVSPVSGVAVENTEDTAHEPPKTPKNSRDLQHEPSTHKQRAIALLNTANRLKGTTPKSEALDALNKALKPVQEFNGGKDMSPGEISFRLDALDAAIAQAEEPRSTLPAFTPETDEPTREPVEGELL